MQIRERRPPRSALLYIKAEDREEASSPSSSVSWEGGVDLLGGNIGFPALAGRLLPHRKPCLRLQPGWAAADLAKSSASESPESTEADLMNPGQRRKPTDLCGKTGKRMAKVAQKRCWRQQKLGSPDPGARRMQRMVYQTVDGGGKRKSLGSTGEAAAPAGGAASGFLGGHAVATSGTTTAAQSTRGGLSSRVQRPLQKGRSGVRSHQRHQNCHHSSSNLFIHLRSRQENFLRTPRDLKRTPTLETPGLGGQVRHPLPSCGINFRISFAKLSEVS